MQLSRRVALDGVQLDEQDPRIAIQSVQTMAAKGNGGNTSVRFGGSGSRRIPGHREFLEISVGFSVVIKKGFAAERETVVETVNAWAAIAGDGAWLTSASKPGKRIRVYLEEPAVIGDARSNASKTMTIKFRAYGVPFWQDAEPRSVLLADGNTGTGSLEIGGNTKTCAEIRMENISGQRISWIEATVGSSTIRCEDLNMNGGESFVIDHDTEGLIRIRIEDARGSSRSAMATRTAGSADDFRVSPGMALVSFRSERACRVTASARGRWL